MLKAHADACTTLFKSFQIVFMIYRTLCWLMTSGPLVSLSKPSPLSKKSPPVRDKLRRVQQLTVENLSAMRTRLIYDSWKRQRLQEGNSLSARDRHEG